MRSISVLSARRLVGAVVAAGAVGVVLTLAGVSTPLQMLLVLLFLTVAPTAAIAGLLRGLDMFPRLLTAATATIIINALVAETTLYAGSFPSRTQLIAIVLIAAAVAVVQPPRIRAVVNAWLPVTRVAKPHDATLAGDADGSEPSSVGTRSSVGTSSVGRSRSSVGTSSSVGMRSSVGPSRSSGRPIVVGRWAVSVRHETAAAAGDPDSARWRAGATSTSRPPGRRWIHQVPQPCQLVFRLVVRSPGAGGPGAGGPGAGGPGAAWPGAGGPGAAGPGAGGPGAAGPGAAGLDGAGRDGAGHRCRWAPKRAQLGLLRRPCLASRPGRVGARTALKAGGTRTPHAAPGHGRP